MDPTVLVAKVPSFNLFLLKRGFRARPAVVTKILLERIAVNRCPVSARAAGPTLKIISLKRMAHIPHHFERVTPHRLSLGEPLPQGTCYRPQGTSFTAPIVPVDQMRIPGALPPCGREKPIRDC